MRLFAVIALAPIAAAKSCISPSIGAWTNAAENFWPWQEAHSPAGTFRPRVMVLALAVLRNSGLVPTGWLVVASKDDCVADLFYGTDYHSHLGTRRGGLVTTSDGGFKRNIHDISNAPFRTKFEDELAKHQGAFGVGIISDYTGKSEFDRTVTDIVGNNIADLVRDNINYCDLVDEIDVSDVASYIKIGRLAAEINTGDIAAEISLHDIASELSVSDIADEIDIESLADTIADQHMTDIAAEVSEKIDYKKLATALLDVIAERSKPATTA